MRRRVLIGRLPSPWICSILVALAGCSSEPTSKPPSVDDVPPARIGDLSARLVDDHRVLLSWTAPGDDANEGTATYYVIRYSEGTLDETTWASAPVLATLIDPQPAGRLETMTTATFEYGDWSFALKAGDERSNWSVLSNVARLELVDVTPPSAVDDLELVTAEGDSVVLRWTAPGGDGTRGRALRYELRRSSNLITDANWPDALAVEGAAAPDSAGSIEQLTVRDLDLSVVQNFALKSVDAAGNESALSNQVHTTPEALVQITNFTQGFGASDPAWSPDGATILFAAQSDAQSGAHILALRPFGGVPSRQLLGFYEEFAPDWSSDGTRFCFVGDSGIGDNPRNLWVKSATLGSAPTRFYTDPSRNIRDCAWSPDESAVAFSAYTTPPEHDFTSEIYLVSASGGEAVQWSSGGANNTSPSWSPDGSQIVFVSDRSGSHEIWVAPAAGGPASQLTHDEAYVSGPAWSPDGSTILFSSNRSGSADLWTMAPDGTNLVHLTTLPESEVSGCWSPDGSSVCFVAGSTIGNLWTLRLR